MSGMSDLRSIFYLHAHSPFLALKRPVLWARRRRPNGKSSQRRGSGKNTKSWETLGKSYRSLLPLSSANSEGNQQLWSWQSPTPAELSNTPHLSIQMVLSNIRATLARFSVAPSSSEAAGGNSPERKHNHWWNLRDSLQSQGSLHVSDGPQWWSSCGGLSAIRA